MSGHVTGRVLVAMSGGVDSSVAAAMLAEQGYEVVGATMKLWGGESDQGCCSVSDVDDARRVADHLGIDHHVFAFSEEFDRHVVSPYVAAHAAGQTPNPCIECNRHLKFDALVARADRLGFDAVATGHHARIVLMADGTRRVARGADAAKDQSYVLHMLDQPTLARVRFPLGELTKDVVRRRAGELGLRTADKPDSQDVCFVSSTQGRSGFLGERMDLHPGRLVDGDGTEVGRVPAVELVTVGQRRGLGLAGGAEHRYAVDVDVATATVTIGTASDLRTRQTVVVDPVWAAGPHVGDVLVQVSAHGEPRPAALRADDAGGGLVVEWSATTRRVAPGQSVVFYDPEHPDTVLGGGRAAASPRPA